MDVSVGAWTVMRMSWQYVHVERLVGAYELAFRFEVTVLPFDNVPRELVIFGAQISLQTSTGEQRLGFSRLEEPLHVKQTAQSSQTHATFAIPLVPNQIGAIEELRASDEALAFVLRLSGKGRGGEYTNPLNARLSVDVPRSRWLQILRDARVLDILLVEVPIPFVDAPEYWKSVTGDLLEAQRQYHGGEYTSAVVACRKVVQELGQKIYSEREWSGPQLDLLGAQRRNMTKEQREAAVYAAIRHLTHLAAHSDGERGAVYSRREAKLILSLTAAIVASNVGA
jgi:hypothetical protein